MKEIDTETKLKALELYVQGKSNREIATELGISPKNRLDNRSPHV